MSHNDPAGAGSFFLVKNMKAILGRKIGPTQTFTPEGKRVSVTEIEAGPCWITAIAQTPTYKSIQLGFGETKNLSKAEIGHIKKAGLDKKLRFLRAFQVTDLAETDKPGVQVNVSDVFTVGDAITVMGISKGKGFAGGVKRHHFKGGPKTHGQSDRERGPGSIGMTTTPGRVFKGKRMAGRLGSDQVTVKGLKVVSINAEKNILTVKGLVPGAKNSLLVVEKE
jgi:large subunit ribosomal protein L3